MQYRLNLFPPVQVLVFLNPPDSVTILVSLLVSLFSTVLMMGMVTVSAASKMTALLFESVFLSV